MNLLAVSTLGDYVSSSLLLPALSDSERAVLQNLKWEERISDERMLRYAGCYSGSKIVDMGELRNQHATYAEQFLELEVGLRRRLNEPRLRRPVVSGLRSSAQKVQDRYG